MIKLNTFRKRCNSYIICIAFSLKYSWTQHNFLTFIQCPISFTLFNTKVYARNNYRYPILCTKLSICNQRARCIYSCLLFHAIGVSISNTFDASDQYLYLSFSLLFPRSLLLFSFLRGFARAPSASCLGVTRE